MHFRCDFTSQIGDTALTMKYCSKKMTSTDVASTNILKSSKCVQGSDCSDKLSGVWLDKDTDADCSRVQRVKSSECCAACQIVCYSLFDVNFTSGISMTNILCKG